MVDDVLGDGIEPVVTGNEFVLLAQHSAEFALLFFVEVRLLDDRKEVFSERRVCNGDVRDAVLVVERDCRVVRR